MADTCFVPLLPQHVRKICHAYAMPAGKGIYDSVILYWQKKQVYTKHSKIFKVYLVGIPAPLKNMKVKWDDRSQYMDSHKSHLPNHQSDIVVPK